MKHKEYLYSYKPVSDTVNEDEEQGYTAEVDMGCSVCVQGDVPLYKGSYW